MGRTLRGRHHSLVTPIDWKPLDDGDFDTHPFVCHHSLVTPIDWKLVEINVIPVGAFRQVTTRW